MALSTITSNIDSILGLSLAVTPSNREESTVLSLGYDQTQSTCEIIVRHTGDPSFLSRYPDVMEFRPLVNAYAIVTVPVSFVDVLAKAPEVLYIEKPKAFFLGPLELPSDSNSLRQVPPMNTPNTLLPNLPQQYPGKGVLIGIIDSGIDYSHPDFLDANGNSRILALWDQTLPPGMQFYNNEELTLAANATSSQDKAAICPSFDLSGHGTHVAGIAAGTYGIAPQSSLIIVKLANDRNASFPGTVQLMEAANYCVEKSLEFQMPLALNLSYGSVYGARNGVTLLDTFLDQLSYQGRSIFVSGTGNEGDKPNHINSEIAGDVAEFTIGPYETAVSIQLWKAYSDTYDIRFQSATSSVAREIAPTFGSQSITFPGLKLLLFYGVPSPYSPFQEIFLQLLPEDSSAFLPQGLYRIFLTPRDVRLGTWNLWLSSESGGSSSGFLTPSPFTTLTLPSAGNRILSVGSYNPSNDNYSSFSGRGYTSDTNQIKPDLVAPGENILSCAPGGGYSIRTGTSMATPFVTGVCARYMEYGIIDGNDPDLYGEKLKATLHRNARRLPGYQKYPNPQTGYGALSFGSL